MSKLLLCAFHQSLADCVYASGLLLSMCQHACQGTTSESISKFFTYCCAGPPQPNQYVSMHRACFSACANMSVRALTLFEAVKISTSVAFLDHRTLVSTCLRIRPASEHMLRWVSGHGVHFRHSASPHLLLCLFTTASSAYVCIQACFLACSKDAC